MKFGDLESGTKFKMSVEGTAQKSFGRVVAEYIDADGDESYFYPPQDAEVEVAAPSEPKNLFAVVTVGLRTYIRLSGSYYPWFVAAGDDEGFSWREIEEYARDHGVAIEVKHEGVSE